MSHRPNGMSGESSRSVKRSTIPFDQYPSPKIFKLHVLCCNEIFDYLSLNDLLSMGQTCVRFNKIVGKYFQEKYPNVEFICRSDDEIQFKQKEIGACSEFIQNLKIHIESVDQFKYIATNCKSLKNLYIETNPNAIIKQLTPELIECIKEILPKLQKIQLKGYELGFVGDFYKDFLRMCINLKELGILSMDVGNTWLRHRYPEIQHVRYYTSAAKQEDWNVLFKLNPQIQSFDCNAAVLLMNKDSFLTSNITLKRLTVSAIDDKMHIQNPTYITYITDTCNLLKSLHERNFYEKLEFGIGVIYLFSSDPNDFTKLRDLDKFNFLSSSWVYVNVFNGPLPIMEDVKELTIAQLEVSAAPFPNVEKVILKKPKITQMLFFIESSINLKEIHIAGSDSIPKYPSDFINEYKSLNLLQWNTEREKLGRASKVTIYVDEEIFNFNNSETNFSLIEVKKIRE